MRQEDIQLILDKKRRDLYKLEQEILDYTLKLAKCGHKYSPYFNDYSIVEKTLELESFYCSLEEENKWLSCTGIYKNHIFSIKIPYVPTLQIVAYIYDKNDCRYFIGEFDNLQEIRDKMDRAVEIVGTKKTFLNKVKERLFS